MGQLITTFEPGAMVQDDVTFSEGTAYTSAPQIVQYATAYGTSSSPVDVTATLSSSPTVGNLLVLFAIGSTQTDWADPTGFIRQTSYRSPAADGRNRFAVIWTRVVQAGDGTSYTVVASGGYPGNACGVGLHEISNADVAAISASSGTTGVIGSTTVQASGIQGATNALGLCVFVTTDGYLGTVVQSGWRLEATIGPGTHGAYASPLLFAMGTVPSADLTLTGLSSGLDDPASYAFIVIPSTVTPSAPAYPPYVTDEMLIKISQLAKFAAARKEVFNMGYYHNTDSPSTPISPIDGSDINDTELIYIPVFATSGPITNGFIPGQLGPPQLDPDEHGRVLICPYLNYFDWQNGKVIDEIYAFDTGHINSTIYNWGASLLFAVGQRESFQYPTSYNTALGRGGTGVASSGGGTAPGTSSTDGGSMSPASNPTASTNNRSNSLDGTSNPNLPEPTALFFVQSTALGGFSFAHGLDLSTNTIQQVTVYMITSGDILYIGFDSTYLYFRASAGNLEASVLVWVVTP